MLIVMGEMLEVSKANKTGRQTCHDGSGFHGFAAHRLRATGHGQGAGGGDAQTRHGLRT